MKEFDALYKLLSSKENVKTSPFHQQEPTLLSSGDAEVLRIASSPENQEERKFYGPGCDNTGQINYDLPPRGINAGKPPPGLRNHDCREDGHRDPDNSGLCIHCSADLAEEELCVGCENMIDKGIDGNCPVCDAEHFFKE